jgi:hypothetical protein
VVVASACLACSNSATSTPASDTFDASGDATPSLCATDKRGQTFVPGLEQAGKAGIFKMKLLGIMPAPAAIGSNHWVVQLLDAQEGPVSGAVVTLTPAMPDHADAVAPTPSVSDQNTLGHYSVANLELPVPGVWTFTFSATTQADGSPPKTDTMVFTFCVWD